MPVSELLADGQILTIIYDGDCPVCRTYVDYTRLKNTLTIELIDVRQRPEIIQPLGERGMDLNEGMVVAYGGQYYYGADAMHFLATLTTPINGFNRLMAWVFASSKRSKLFYPVLRLGRCLLLLILRRPPLKTHSTL